MVLITNAYRFIVSFAISQIQFQRLSLFFLPDTQLIKASTESDSKIVHMESTKDDPSKRKPDISLAKREMGWEPAVSVHEASISSS